MRQTFAQALLEEARKDKSIILVTADLGYFVWDKFREELPDQFINTGAAEQAAMGIAVGLALSGMKPFVYSITPFLLCRPYETIRNYIDHEKIPVRLVGSGRYDNYLHDGFSHYAGDDAQIMDTFTNIEPVWPGLKENIPQYVKDMVNTDKPWYINLSK